MKDQLATRELAPGIIAHYRPGSSDEDALTEVITRHAYRRLKDGFDVEPGEKWLDLGANVGAFSLYVRMRQATAVCYEPDPDCFSILQLNAPAFTLHNMAVTDSKEPSLTFYRSKNPDNHYRNTFVPVKTYEEIPTKFMNIHGSIFADSVYDGVKCDIEGAEFGLIDNWLFPKCKKLVMEYHHSRDSSWQNLAKRIKVLQAHFKNVHYQRMLKDYIEYKGKTPLPRFDTNIFCWN